MRVTSRSGDIWTPPRGGAPQDPPGRTGWRERARRAEEWKNEEKQKSREKQRDVVEKQLKAEIRRETRRGD